MTEQQKPDTVIKSTDQFDKLIKDRQEKNDKRIVDKSKFQKDTPICNHAEMSSLYLKVVNMIKMDPWIKKVMTRRIMGPMINGRETTHLSIALELGMSESEVIEVERAGMQIVSKHIDKVSSPDFIQKFNRDQKVKTEVSKLIDSTGKNNGK